MALRAQILGHSFVKHLNNFISRSPEHSFKLGLQEPALIQYSGLPGATVHHIRDQLEAVTDFDPHLIFLVIGTHDLSNSENTPETVACSILDLADTLLFFCGVTSVVVCHIFHRIPASKPVKYPVDIVWFNDRVNQTNHILREKLHSDHPSKTYFWYCNGFWAP
ncbi:hypothetical protein DPMN_160970 [Dreissena polymorpha]|uniref:Uncharacterized protein n=1 Tax=Dreissena polymorpha TaxID=45954 RepID=A0A9D4EPI8_DREPO|nr:hypothetical protein DPMN_160970 [Dreissena polymorpha]